MEEKKQELDFDEIVKGITEATTVKDLVGKGMTEEMAQVAIKAYKRGCDDNYWKYYRLNEKHRDVCVKVCEKLL